MTITGKRLFLLPEQRRTCPRDPNAVGLVLDFDNTLVCTMNGVYENQVPRDTERLYITPTLNMWGFERPGLHEFINFCQSRFCPLILWSAGDNSYINDTVPAVLPEVFDAVYTRQNLRGPRSKLKKELLLLTTNGENPYLASTFNYSDLHLDRLLIVDDNPDFIVDGERENHILIPAYDPALGQPDNDRALYELMDFWKRNPPKPDVRTQLKTGIFSAFGK